MMKRIIVVLTVVLSVGWVQAQPVVLTLDSCRSMALHSTVKSRIDEENVLAAKYARQAVTARFFPQVSANGVWAPAVWTTLKVPGAVLWSIPGPTGL